MQIGMPSSLTRGADGAMMESVAADGGGIERINSATREECFRKVEQRAGGGRGTIACNQ